jgi:hypothetical protein
LRQARPSSALLIGDEEKLRKPASQLIGKSLINSAAAADMRGCGSLRRSPGTYVANTDPDYGQPTMRLGAGEESALKARFIALFVADENRRFSSEGSPTL